MGALGVWGGMEGMEAMGGMWSLIKTPRRFRILRPCSRGVQNIVGRAGLPVPSILSPPLAGVRAARQRGKETSLADYILHLSRTWVQYSKLFVRLRQI